MDKESIIMGLIVSALIGFAIYGILHELQPILLAAVNFTGIVLVILTCAGSLCVCLIVIFLFTGRTDSAGSVIAYELVEQRRINKINRINQMILHDQLKARREYLRNLEIEHLPDDIKHSRWGGYVS